MPGVDVRRARTAAEISDARTLVEEYIASLGIDLEFQGLAEELRRFPGEYAAPNGELLVAYVGTAPAGAVGLRRIDEATCEMKRMFVRPQYRRHGIGRALCRQLLADSVAMGYRTMRLDTLGTMDAAIALYRTFGFREIPPYRYNPIPGAVFLEVDLSQELPRT